jgi:hypothetical protein
MQASKRKEGYANFKPSNPPVNLALNEATAEHGAETRLSHLGIEVEDTGEVAAAAARMAKAGRSTIEQDQVTCCYAVQDKVWVHDPDGNAWEFFVVTQADTEFHSDVPGPEDLRCCPDESVPAASQSGCCPDKSATRCC